MADISSNLLEYPFKWDDFVKYPRKSGWFHDTSYSNELDLYATILGEYFGTVLL